MAMKTFFALYLLSIAPFLWSEDYLDALKQPRGDYKLGEIEIVCDPQKIEEIQQCYYERLRERGVPAERATKWSKVGEVMRDKYFLFVRDPVIFPSGATGLYDRILSESNGGSAVLPIFSNGEIGLVVQFRHATRTWELELPRGGTLPGETPLETAKRELKEETGLEAADWQQLGIMNPDSGVLQWSVPIFVARNLEEKDAAIEESEAIDQLIHLTKGELNEALKEGAIELEIKGVKRKVFVRDAYLTYALYLHSLNS